MSQLFMSRGSSNDKVPQGFIIAAGVMVVASLVMVSVARLTGYQPPQPPPSAIVEQRDFRFVDRADGAVLVYDSADGHLAYTVEPSTEGFVRGVLRGLVRERRADRIGSTPPFRLTHWADGRLSLDDPSTGRHVDLEVFGPTNASAFAAILIADDAHKVAGEAHKDQLAQKDRS